MKVTIKEVAKEAGVSISTVSRVLSNPDSVKEDNVKKVQAAVEKLQYIPSITAQNVSGSLKNIGVILGGEDENSLLSPYTSEVLRGIMNATQKKGYHIQLLTFGRSEENAKELIKLQKSGRIDAYILLSSMREDIFIKKFWEEKVKFVVNGNIYDEGLKEELYSVDTLNQEDSYLAVSYLLRLGHRRVGMINSSVDYTVNYERQKGYEEALGKYGIEVDKGIILETGEEVEDTEEKVRKFLLKNPDLTAVFCKNDIKARIVINVANELGLNVPENLSVIGHNDTYLSQMAKPQITTVRVPIYQMGKKLASSVIAQLEGKEIEKRIELESDLLIKDTCKKL